MVGTVATVREGKQLKFKKTAMISSERNRIFAGATVFAADEGCAGKDDLTFMSSHFC